MRLRKRDVVVGAIAIAFTVVVGLVALNLRTGEKEIEQAVPRLYGVSDAQFARAMGVLLGPPILDGNRFQVLLNGDEIFPSMLAAIRTAKATISFESYIYWSGIVGEQFAEALAERARAGVRVHLLLDWLGSSKIDKQQLELMERAGVEVRRFHEPKWYQLARLNNRTHRKLLIVDGNVGFTGGVGIADEWSGHAQDPQHWRDTHFRIEGPAVAQMQSAFMDNWVEVTGEVLHGEGYFPAIERRGDHYAQVFTSSPGGGAESMQLMYLLSIAAAAHSIRMSASYFVPDNVSVDMFTKALERGVKVQIILPGPHIDTSIVRRASRATWGPLLRAGAEIYEYEPTMFHCKVMVVDDLWTSVGSTNFDNRSFAVNDEANLNVYDAEFARRQVAIFEQDLKRSRRITLQEWENRPWTEKVWEHTLGLLSSQL
jgi:cardiolipin synthase